MIYGLIAAFIILVVIAAVLPALGVPIPHLLYVLLVVAAIILLIVIILMAVGVISGGRITDRT